jgi:hypothetical protein
MAPSRLIPDGAFSMKKFVLRNYRGFRMFLAIYQIAGAIAMFLVIAFNIKVFSVATFIFLLPIIGLCLVSLMAGISYIQKNEVRFFVLSKINFWAQTVQFSFIIFGFAYYYGPYLYIGIGEGGFKIGLEFLTAFFNVNINSGENFYLLVNGIPLFFLRALRWIEKIPVVAELENAFVENTPQNL